MKRHLIYIATRFAALSAGAVMTLTLIGGAMLLPGCSKEGDNDRLPDGAYPLTISATVDGTAEGNLAVKSAAGANFGAASGVKSASAAGSNIATQSGADFGAMNAPATRAVADIGSVGVFVAGGTTYNNAEYTGNGGSGLTGTLTPATQGYWGSKSDISIYAYAPYAGTAPTSISVAADQSIAANYTASDFLYAAPTTFAFADHANISLAFKHRLSKINLTVVKGAGITDAEFNALVAAAQVTGLNTTAGITLADGSLGALSNPQAVTPNSSGTNKYKAIVIPQTAAAGTRLFTVGAFSYAVPAVQTFDGGKEYNYTLTLSQSGISVTAGEITAWTEDTKDPSGTASTTYKLGDYYPDPNVVYEDDGVGGRRVKSGVPAIGIVFWLDTSAAGYNATAKSGISGKIVSLDENHTALWDRENEGENSGFFDTKAKDFADGRANMATIMSWIGSPAATLEGATKDWLNFPAFAWVDLKNGTQGTTVYAGGQKGVWYLPANDELKAISSGISDLNFGTDITWNNADVMPNYDNYGAQRAAFNGKITAAGGMAIATSIETVYYWSSTENSYFGAWYIYLYDGYTHFTTKQMWSRIRAIQAF